MISSYLNRKVRARKDKVCVKQHVCQYLNIVEFSIYCYKTIKLLIK